MDLANQPVRSCPKTRKTPEKSKILKLICKYCGTEFEKKSSLLTKSALQNPSRFCSFACAVNSRKHGEHRKCLNCDKEFYTSVSKNKKYCCKKCDAIGNPRKGFITNVNNSGENNGQYKHGKYVGRGRAGGSAAKEKVRKLVIERDGGKWCLLCGKPGPGLHLHRVMYGSQGGQYELTNCVLLCSEDHHMVHSSKRTWQPELIEYLKTLDPEGIRHKRKLQEAAE